MGRALERTSLSPWVQKECPTVLYLQRLTLAWSLTFVLLCVSMWEAWHAAQEPPVFRYPSGSMDKELPQRGLSYSR